MPFDQLRRRQFIALLGGAATAWPLAARAQRPARVPRIGIIDAAPMWHSFRRALRELGYVEGQSVNYEYRYSEGVPDRLATVVGEFVRRPVDLIAAYGTPPTVAAKTATTTIPIVMVGVADPVRAGLVASLGSAVPVTPGSFGIRVPFTKAVMLAVRLASISLGSRPRSASFAPSSTIAASGIPPSSVQSSLARPPAAT